MVPRLFSLIFEFEPALRWQANSAAVLWPGAGQSEPVLPWGGRKFDGDFSEAYNRLRWSVLRTVPVLPLHRQDRAGGDG